MEISKKSWHYRFNLYWIQFQDETLMPKTVCSYFWTTVANILRSIGTVTAMSVFFVLLSVFLLSPLLRLFMPYEGIRNMSVPAMVLYGIILVVSTCQYLKSKLSFTNVSFEYVKAVKSRVCPLIKYGDE